MKVGQGNSIPAAAQGTQAGAADSRRILPAMRPQARRAHHASGRLDQLRRARMPLPHPPLRMIDHFGSNDLPGPSPLGRRWRAARRMRAGGFIANIRAAATRPNPSTFASHPLQEGEAPFQCRVFDGVARPPISGSPSLPGKGSGVRCNRISRGAAIGAAPSPARHDACKREQAPRRPASPANERARRGGGARP